MYQNVGWLSVRALDVHLNILLEHALCSYVLWNIKHDSYQLILIYEEENVSWLNSLSK